MLVFKKFFLSSLVFFPAVCLAQQVDPLLAGAIEVQTLELKKAYSAREKMQDEIIFAQGVVAANLAMIHDVESKFLEYSSNASSAMNNLYQLKRAAELVTNVIPNQISKLSSAIPENYKGTAITALTSNTISEVSMEMVSLYGFMSDLVTSTAYSFKDEISGSSKKNVNLLSASERYYIANEVVSRLEKASRKLQYLTWQVEHLGWKDLCKKFDPETYYNAERGKDIAERLIQEWKNTKF